MTSERAPRPGREALRSVRIRILAWVVLLSALALAVAGGAFYLVERERADRRISTELAREAAEFEAFAKGSVDPATGATYTSADRLLRASLRRNVPEEHQALLGFVDGKPAYVQGTRAAALADADEFVAAIAAVRDGGSGEVDVAGQTVRFAAKAVQAPRSDGTFVAAFFVEAERAELHEAVRSYALVALVALLAVAAGAASVAGRLLRPLRELRATAEQIGHTDLTRRIEVTGHDDVSDLAVTFNRMLDRLEEAFATQRRFLDDAGHELRTPITIVRGHLELMAVEDLPETRALVLDELDRMSRLVDDLIMLARAERPDFLRPSFVDVSALTDEVLDKARGLAPRRWRCDARADVSIAADSQRLTQAMLQLAANAVAQTGPNDSIAVGSALRPGCVELWVRDTGPGVAPADAERIFRRFERAGNSAGDGAGLGLSIVRAIAVAHGGTVRLQSTPGHGATFTLELPWAPDQSVAGAVAATASNEER